MCIQVDCMHIPVFLCLHIDRQAISTTQFILFLRQLSFLIINNAIRAISPFSCHLCNTPFMSPVVSHLVVHVCLSSASMLLAVIKKMHTLQQRNKTEMQILCNIMSSPCHVIFPIYSLERVQCDNDRILLYLSGLEHYSVCH